MKINELCLLGIRCFGLRYAILASYDLGNWDESSSRLTEFRLNDDDDKQRKITARKNPNF